MDIVVRPAQEEELRTLLAFEKGIVRAERPYDSTLKEGEIHYYNLLELIKSSEAEVVVAEVNNVLVGSGFAEIRMAKSYLDHSHFAYLGFMYVDPEYRGNGINQLILDALKDWSKSKGINELRLEVYNENIIAKKAYVKAGFTPNLLEMRIEI